VSLRQFGAGYRIIAPMRADDGRVVLIDRGFVPVQGHTRARALGPMTVTGNLHWPDEVDSFTPEPDRKANIWFARDVPALAAELGTEPLLVIARSRTDANISPLPVDSAVIPNDHLQYAVTWFGLALVWAAMTILFLRRRTRGNGE
jgi:surfeit locus 1 family protein